MAKARWARDRAMRDQLVEQESERRKNLVVILRDNRTGEERAFPWDGRVYSRLRFYAELQTEW